LLKEKQALALLRAQLERKREKEYWGCKKFGHLAYNCRNQNEKKENSTPQNKFKVLLNKVI